MKYLPAFTKNITKVLIGLLIVILIFSLFEFVLLVIRAALKYHAAFDIGAETLNKENLFLSQVQGLISAILLLTIIVELIHSLAEYIRAGSTNYVIIISEIALIAIVRHILGLDIEHTNPLSLFGLSALIFVLGLFYLIASKKVSFEKNGDPLK